MNAHRERTGAHLVAEGIETPEHLASAVGMGATLGQGWLFGRPAPLPARLPWVPQGLGRASQPGRGIPGATPYEVVRSRLAPQQATKPLLLAISLHLEHQAQALGAEAVVLSAFQSVERFTPATRVRYAALAERAALVGALGVNLDVAPAQGVRGAHIGLGDPLTDEWSVVVVGPHFRRSLTSFCTPMNCTTCPSRHTGDRKTSFQNGVPLLAAARARWSTRSETRSSSRRRDASTFPPSGVACGVPRRSRAAEGISPRPGFGARLAQSPWTAALL